VIILKTKNEIQIMREAGQINYECHQEIRKHIAEGVSTYELDRIAEEFILKKGAKPAFKGYRVGGKRYPATINSSINEEVVHGIPSKKRKLKNGDIISIDLGCIWKNYYADSAYTWPVGEISEEKKRLLRVTEECLYLGIKESVAGKRISDISAAVQKHAESNGYSVIRQLTGHGVGRKLHEDPQVPNFVEKRPGTVDRKLKRGLVFAIEPMINIGKYEVKELSDGWTFVTVDGKPSAHFEHTIAVTDEGPVILTAPEDEILLKEKEFSCLMSN